MSRVDEPEVSKFANTPIYRTIELIGGESESGRATFSATMEKRNFNLFFVNHIKVPVMIFDVVVNYNHV